MLQKCKYLVYGSLLNEYFVLVTYQIKEAHLRDTFGLWLLVMICIIYYYILWNRIQLYLPQREICCAHAQSHQKQ